MWDKSQFTSLKQNFLPYQPSPPQIRKLSLISKENNIIHYVTLYKGWEKYMSFFKCVIYF